MNEEKLWEIIEKKLQDQISKKWDAKNIVKLELDWEFFADHELFKGFITSILNSAQKFPKNKNLTNTNAFVDSNIFGNLVKVDFGYSGIIKKENLGKILTEILFLNISVNDNPLKGNHYGPYNPLASLITQEKKINYFENINWLMENLPYQKRMWSYFFKEDIKDNFFELFINEVKKNSFLITEELYLLGYSYGESLEMINHEIREYEKPLLEKKLRKELEDKPEIKKNKI